MIDLSRRKLLTIGAGLLVAPAIVRASSIMKVRPIAGLLEPNLSVSIGYVLANASGVVVRDNRQPSPGAPFGMPEWSVDSETWRPVTRDFLEALDRSGLSRRWLDPFPELYGALV